MTTLEFQEIRLEGPTFAVTLQWLGEGNDGDYNPNDPEDEPLLRFDTDRRIDGGWEEVDAGRYCVHFRADITAEDAQLAAKYLLDRIEIAGGSHPKRLCEQLSWTTMKDVHEHYATVVTP